MYSGHSNGVTSTRLNSVDPQLNKLKNFIQLTIIVIKNTIDNKSFYTSVIQNEEPIVENNFIDINISIFVSYITSYSNEC